MEERSQLVENFETRFGLRLPEDFREFLLAGPVPVWTDEESPENPATELLHSFFDLGVDEDRDLVARLEQHGSDLPGWFLPIGEQFGVLIGLGIDGPQSGRVFQWAWDDGEARELAPSFTEFLEDARQEEAQWNERGDA